MTCEELLADIRARNPGRRFARNASCTAIAVWTGERWSAVASLVIGDANGSGGKWVACRPGELDVAINGVPVFPQEGWTE